MYTFTKKKKIKKKITEVNVDKLWHRDDQEY